MTPTIVVTSGPPGTGKSTLASAAAKHLGASVLAWDWVMASMTRFPEVQGAFRVMEPSEYIEVGWSIMWNLAIAQVRDGRSVVLDGVARTPQVERVRAIAAEEGAACVLIATRCSDVDLHRSRIEGRLRNIPGWHELTWENVARFLDAWVEPTDVDVRVDAADPLDANIERVIDAL